MAATTRQRGRRTTAAAAARPCTRCPAPMRARCQDKRHHCGACSGIGIVPDAMRGYAGCTCIRPRKASSP